MITGRGGGSIEDLWAFNDERVARAIYESEIPVISAVGHEPDVTIADYVADARASTPSNAAEIVVPDQRELRRRLAVTRERMAQSETARLEALRKRFAELSAKRALTDPTAFVSDKRMLLDFTRSNLASAAERQLAGRQRKYAALCASLDALSPLKVLGRGYAVARGADGRVLRRAADAAIGEKIDLILEKGRLDCVVEARETEGDRHG